MNKNMMALGALALALPGLFIVGELLLFFLRRAFAWMDDRGWITMWSDPPSYRSLGNAFLEVQALTQPEKMHLLREHKRERAEQQESGDGVEPGA